MSVRSRQKRRNNVDRLACAGVRYRQEFLDGIEHAPDAIAGLDRGENLGSRLIRLR
jgi:NADPH-dependent curcumin reductase CurA